MKALPSLIAIGIVLSAACYAQRCPDPKSQQAAIDGDTKTIWAGSTDDIGSFPIKGLRRGTYRLTVKGWGSTIIRINPDLTHSFGNGQMLYYSLLLVDNECIWTIMVEN